VASGYKKKIFEIDLTLEDMKTIVADLVDSKENAALYSHQNSTRTVTEVNE